MLVEIRLNQWSSKGEGGAMVLNDEGLDLGCRGMMSKILTISMYNFLIVKLLLGDHRHIIVTSTTTLCDHKKKNIRAIISPTLYQNVKKPTMNRQTQASHWMKYVLHLYCFFSVKSIFFFLIYHFFFFLIQKVFKYSTFNSQSGPAQGFVRLKTKFFFIFLYGWSEGS